MNYPGEGFQEMTKAEYNAVHSCHRYIRRFSATDEHAAYRVRTVYVSGKWTNEPVYLTDQKRVDLPAPIAAGPRLSPPMRDFVVMPVSIESEVDPLAADVMAMQESLKAGVKATTVHQLFPTPLVEASAMVEEAEIEDGHSVLEPSFGSKRLLQAIREHAPAALVTAVEINQELFAAAKMEDARHLICGDFRKLTPHRLGSFDRIVMNPPFENGADIRHIQHARRFLKPGGRIVALCANGPGQNAVLKPIAETSGGYWEALPAGAFKEEGTMVNVARLVIEA